MRDKAAIFLSSILLLEFIRGVDLEVKTLELWLVNIKSIRFRSISFFDYLYVLKAAQSPTVTLQFGQRKGISPNRRQRFGGYNWANLNKEVRNPSEGKEQRTNPCPQPQPQRKLVK
ncbi:hypothetical protein WN943_021228 [Citrus x changshan-huyou]